MRIKIIQEDDKVYVAVNIVSPVLGKFVFPIVFLIDTGSYKTTIAPLDAEDIGVNFKKLHRTKKPSNVIDGKMKCEYNLRDVSFQFSSTVKKKAYFHLNEIDVIKPGKKRSPMPSLLGTDILKNFTFTYGKKSKLETN